ncbi:receptor-like protein EIX2 [Pistacia vera]|uniref:receptor-like protein EIX2 n=1 Tax=Pistacia vera TaxID=55513 RepID=UPI0012631B37|nr:receptor-like protein EIX2 [Pistacia vera]
MNIVAIAIFYLNLLVLTAINFSFCSGSSCIESERHALLRFKQDLEDPSNRLASWTNFDGDCCTWTGVVCDNFTGHILKLKLRSPSRGRRSLSGKVNPSLLDLKHLIYLDLSYNAFDGIRIPSFLGSFGELRHLNLSEAGFAGEIPHQLGNLSNLQYLDLGQNDYPLYIDNIRWLSGLSSLKYLDLTVVNLSKTSADLFLIINALPSLGVLQLSNCELHHLPTLSTANFSSSLVTLDLSQNKFNSSFIPNWVFGLTQLQFLNLARNGFRGPIPDGLQNLTSLTHLDLSRNNFSSSIPNWLYKFSHLECLSLIKNNLQGTISGDIGNLTSMQKIDLSSNALQGRIPRSLGRLCNLRSISLSSVKLNQAVSEILDIFLGCVSHRLEVLNLGQTQLYGQLTSKLGQFKNLDTLFLCCGSIFGPIPHSLGKLSNLKFLDLSSNKLSGSIPFSIGELSSLSSLQLSSNELNGSIPSSFGMLLSLRILDISSNKLNGNLSEIHFFKLSSLESFKASGNSLKLNVNPDWRPSFQLNELYLPSCYVGSRFPSWLLSQKKLGFLDLSNSGILDTIPTKFWKSSFRLRYVNFSHNQIYGKVPSLIEVGSLTSLDLSSNSLAGSLPLLSSTMNTLDVSNNSFSGHVSQFLCHAVNESKNLQILYLKDNSLFGELPDCWTNWQNLEVLDLGENKFIGNLPNSMGKLNSLRSLHLHNNNFSGNIPISFKNCTKLLVLNLHENRFVGNVPLWLGERFSSLMILILRSNKFQGSLPVELCQLASLRILDLAYNNLSGAIPSCISNLSAMVTTLKDFARGIQYVTNYSDSIEDESLMLKGRMDEYSTILNLVRSIDLSKNTFSGEIPIEVTHLKLLSLNLSHNHFTGRIPENIGVMESLESIDLSSNQLNGVIPQSISALTSLNHLNLSHNNLHGEIPLSTQLQTFDASCFMGNELCGPPLPNNCSGIFPIQENENGGNKHEVNGFYVSMALGFVVGFSSLLQWIESDRQALLWFKQGLTDPSNWLSSWIGEGDCCKWAGVVCDNSTGHVHELHLGNPDAYNGILHLGGLSLLEYLDLSLVNLGKTSVDLLFIANALPSLVVLQLSGCQLHHLPTVSIANFSSSLVTLDLSGNKFNNSFISNWVFVLSQLQFLDLAGIGFEGPILDGLQNLTSLTHLDLSRNHFSSPIPNWLYKFSHLESLSVSRNSLEGVISSDIGNLTSLQMLDLSSNALQGSIPKSLGRLCNLRWISLSFVKLNQTISEILDIFSRCVSHRLEFLDLAQTQLYGQLTYQLGQFKNLKTLDLCCGNRSGPIPYSLGELSKLTFLDLSFNNLSSPIPFSIGELSSLQTLQLSSNKLNGSIPSSLGKLSSLNFLLIN